MGTKGKKKEGIVTVLDKEEQNVRYDIIENSLWIIVKCLFVLDAAWFVILASKGYESSVSRTFAEVMTVPAILWCAAVCFDKFFMRHKRALHDWTMLLIINSAILFILAGDRWTRSLVFLSVLPVIFCMILKDIRLVYFQIVLSVIMVFADFALSELFRNSKWKYDLLLNLSGILCAVIVTARVVIQIRKYTHMLNIQSTIDSLTRLHNHEAFYQELARKMEEYRENQAPLCILIADIDNFKKVNDTYGHSYGDKVLKSLAGIFLEEESGRCFVARYGGEEFAMIMDLNQEEALTKAQTIRIRFEQQQIPTDSGDTHSFTVSIGVAVCSMGYQNASQFFAKADEAMYRAKKGGKNRVCL